MEVALPTDGGDADIEARIRRKMEQIQHMEASLAAKHRFAEHIRNQPDLFDDADLAKVNAIIAVRNEELAQLRRETQNIMELYRSNVLSIEQRIQRRQQVIEELDNELRIFGTENALCEHFGLRQASMMQALNATKQRLCAKLDRGAADGAGAVDQLLRKDAEDDAESRRKRDDDDSRRRHRSRRVRDYDDS